MTNLPESFRMSLAEKYRAGRLKIKAKLCSKVDDTIKYLFDLGDGYELTYGQLTDITLEEGQQVKAGDVVGKVAEPTIFYSVEGSNVYFKMTKDGEPVNPLEMVE